MLPPKIKKLLENLKDETEDGKHTWNYDDEESIVFLRQEEYTVSIVYSFDTLQEVGRFNVKYTKRESGKDYFFSTDQRYTEYEDVKLLYDIAQSSELDIDL